MDENLDFYNKENSSNSEEKLVKVTGMYKDWFLDYASYVILERAVPAIYDGLKPVQRRIFHSMKDLDDGRYNKVANVVGHTMQYHPHGDASIADAMVQVGQKELLIDTQGNWGNILTGDRAAASRYIEARLSKFALEVVFSPKVTDWQLSYDGRKKEPVHLQVKFPLLLAQGAEGIAVGLSTKILPHNFIELLKGSIQHLKGKKIFTPTLGWSSYCYGFLECPYVEEYVGTDVINSVCKKTKTFATKHYPEKKVEIFNSPSENLSKNASFIKKYTNHFDVVFFSPPYFKLELYSGKNQSTNMYKSYEEWLVKYWEATIQLCFKVLQSNGRLCYILSGYGKNLEYDLVTDMNTVTSKYFTLKKIIPMQNKNVHVTNHRTTGEQIIIFEKK